MVALSASPPLAHTAAPALPPASSGWIVSPRFDIALLGVPAAGTALLLLTPADTGMADGLVPLWAFLLLVVAVDVAHVWATLYLSYLDREAFARRRLLFLL